jgi:hypothetical protein
MLADRAAPLSRRSLAVVSLASVGRTIAIRIEASRRWFSRNRRKEQVEEARSVSGTRRNGRERASERARRPWNINNDQRRAERGDARSHTLIVLHPGPEMAIMAYNYFSGRALFLSATPAGRRRAQVVDARVRRKLFRLVTRSPSRLVL